MSGNLGGVTDLTGLRLGDGGAVPGVSSACSPGTGLVWMSFRTFAVPALTLTANGSTTTAAVFPGAASGDFASAYPTSSMSSGGVLAHAFVSATNAVTLVYSNASTAALAIVAQTVGVKVDRYANT